MSEEAEAQMDALSRTYLVSSSVSLVVCTASFASFAAFKELRAHPAPIILYSLIADVAFSLKYFVLAAAWLGTRDGARTHLVGRSFHILDDGCVTGSLYTQFFSLASSMWNAVWCFNLYLELANPIRSTKPLMKLYHAVVWGTAAFATLLVVVTQSYALAHDQTCWVTASSAASVLTNTLVACTVAGGLASLTYVFLRLRRGLSITREFRRALAMYHALYVLVFVVAWSPFVLVGVWLTFDPDKNVPTVLMHMNAAAYCSQAAAVSLVRLADPRVRKRVYAALYLRVTGRLPPVRMIDYDDDDDDGDGSGGRGMDANTAAGGSMFLRGASRALLTPMSMDDMGESARVDDSTIHEQSLSMSAQARFFHNEHQTAGSGGYTPPPLSLSPGQRADSPSTAPLPVFIRSRKDTVFGAGPGGGGGGGGDGGGDMGSEAETIVSAAPGSLAASSLGAGTNFRHELLVCLFSGLEQALGQEAGYDSPADSRASVDYDAGATLETEAAVAVAVGGQHMPTGTDTRVSFTSYAPAVFAIIRSLASVSRSDLTTSLSAQSYIMGNIHAHFSTAASGSFFCKSPDGKFIVKTMDRKELSVLLDLLPDYVVHLESQPESLLSRFYGAYAMSGGMFKTTYFVIMSNVLTPPASQSAGWYGADAAGLTGLVPPHEFETVYDLKGSTVNRSALKGRDVSEAAPGTVLKDNEFEGREHGLLLGPTLQNQFLEQLEADAALLRSHNIMDFSLLVGVSRIHAAPSVDVEAQAALTIGYDELGGFIVSRNDVEQVVPVEWYAFGLIDLLQTYSVGKRLERSVKQIRHTSRNLDISAVNPEVYARRMVDFFASNTR